MSKLLLIPSHIARLLYFGFAVSRARTAALVFAIAGFGFCAGSMRGDWVSETMSPNAFPLVHAGKAAGVWWDEASDAAVVGIAARDLVADINQVTGVVPILSSGVRLPETPALVVIGTLGQSRLIDELAASGKLAIQDLKGKWESFVITTIESPMPGVQWMLVIVGSDRRGTAYGVYELSQAIGVSPWHWWADVTPVRKAELHVEAGLRRFGPPSVKYRGIFINDEDWGLQPWAAHTFEAESGNIGPKTYQRVFELLLRLKANLLWPGMHPTTRPFNALPENARLADDYAIVMGSSHAEPMLRNNVGEWTLPAADYNYIANRDGVLRYWEDRVKTNGRFENVYTIGMRGIHDSNMVGPRTDAERIEALERLFTDQRDLLKRHVRQEVEQVPQMFCAYKEVLGLYQGGLKIPEDVTIVWPDDNFGFVRNFTSDEERGRAGGFGVYYHLSYLGRPLSYLWLATTPPALVWEEMAKAYAYGADRLWVVNIGDIKPAEISTEFFLQMAWDMKRWRHDNLGEFLPEWAAREFGAEPAQEIARLMNAYYLLNYARKPEHLQWWLPGQLQKRSAFSATEVVERMRAFEQLAEEVNALAPRIPELKRDAFFELVSYPILGSAAANQRYFHGERYAAAFGRDNEKARSHAAAMRLADQALQTLTETYGTQIAGGKWRHFISLEPADNQWASMRIAPAAVPVEGMAAGAEPATFRSMKAGPDDAASRTIDAGDFVRSDGAPDARWVQIDGLGRTGRAVTILPFETKSREGEQANAPWVEYDFEVPSAGDVRVELEFLPTHPIQKNQAQRVKFSIGSGPAHLVSLPVVDGKPEWAEGVLAGYRAIETPVRMERAGKQTLRLQMVDPGVVIDRIRIRFDQSEQK